MNIEVLILAAGASSRFGSPKQLALYKGKPLLMHSVDLLRAAGFRPWVALGANERPIRDCLASYYDLNRDIRLISVPSWKKGISESIKVGVHTISSEKPAVHGVLIALADQPKLVKSDYERLVFSAQEKPDRISCVDYPDGASGVPAFFPHWAFDELMGLRGDEGAKKILGKHVCEVIECTDVSDIDTRADLDRLTE